MPRLETHVTPNGPLGTDDCGKLDCHSGFTHEPSCRCNPLHPKGGRVREGGRRVSVPGNFARCPPPLLSPVPVEGRAEMHAP